MRYDLYALRVWDRFDTVSKAVSKAKATEGKAGCNREGKGRQSHGTRVAIGGRYKKSRSWK